MYYKPEHLESLAAFILKRICIPVAVENTIKTWQKEVKPSVINDIYTFSFLNDKGDTIHTARGVDIEEAQENLNKAFGGNFNPFNQPFTVRASVV